MDSQTRYKLNREKALKTDEPAFKIPDWVWFLLLLALIATGASQAVYIEMFIDWLL